MYNFSYFNPTHIVFGQGRIAEIDQHIPANARVLITYGGQSAEKFGTLAEVRHALGQREYVEFGGIEANPHYETLMKATQLAKEKNVDYLLAVGGGSVVDGTKFIAAAYYHDDVWNHWVNKIPLTRALPMGCVMTLPATGSEMNATSVVSHVASGAKVGFNHPLLFPQFAILDPEKSYTLPAKQVANGVVDAFVHVIEQYLTFPVYGKVQDRFAEGLLLTLLEEGPKALTEPNNYDVRATITWSATLALNGLIGAGVPQDWATHRIGHQLTSLYGLDHAQTLAVLLPSLLYVQRNNKREKLLQYAARIWQLTEGDDETRISQAIAKTRDFFELMGIKTRMRDYGLPQDAVEAIIRNLNTFNLLPQGERQDIDEAMAREILMLSY